MNDLRKPARVKLREPVWIRGKVFFIIQWRKNHSFAQILRADFKICALSISLWSQNGLNILDGDFAGEDGQVASPAQEKDIVIGGRIVVAGLTGKRNGVITDRQIPNSIFV